MPPVARPPTRDPLVALADRCVQCGLCLPACPTYVHDRLEAESPRGRIALARAWALETIDPTSEGEAHLDHCLGCRSCEAVCPAGVDFGGLLLAARERQRQRRGAGWRQRFVEWLTAHSGLLRAALAGYRVVHGLLPGRLRPLPRPPAATPAQQADVPGSDATVALFVGCVAATYEVGLREAVARLCTAVGIALIQPSGQTCCGALHAHAGNAAVRDRLADANRRAFANTGTVLTIASGCHEAVADALADTAATRDALAFLAERAHALRFRETRERVAVHLPCTQRNVVKSTAALRTLLARVPGVEIVELTAGFGCCGAAGMEMLTRPDRAAEYRQPLLQQFESSRATRLLSANIGCRLHFANATQAPVMHPLEFLAERLDATHPAPLAPRRGRGFAVLNRRL
jgi:glycolate oxidase iron-sulfur subunit